MKRQMLSSKAARLGVGSALLMLLLGCGGKTSSPPVPTVAATTAPAAPQFTQSATLTQTLDPLARRGRALFMEEAGPPSCLVCHGKEAAGNPELATPDIRGKTADDVRKAIQNGELMRSVYSTLSDQDIEALVAYLEFLVRQK